MTKRLEEALVKVRALPAVRQDELAAVLSQMAEQPLNSVLSDEQAAEVELAEREAEGGDIATDEEVAALWKKHGL